MNDGSQHAAPPMWLWVPAECDEPSWSATIAQRVIGTMPFGETRASEGYSERPLRPMLEAVTAVGGTSRGAWAARPWRARGLRLLVYGLPVAGSLGFVRLATVATGVPTESLGIFLVWWFAMSLAATGFVAVAYRLTRRLLPLGALLELSLAFPDEAPSRFRLALGTGTVESLEERLRRMREAGDAATAQEAAEILLRLVAALDVHDRITRGHAERVRAYAYSLGRELGFSADDLDRLNWAALLHDVGKLEVSTEILNKPGRPTDEEWQQLRAHPLYGESLVAPLREWLGDWADAVGYHHERWDGTGYPRGVGGVEIPLAGRIVAIADVFDVITSSRSYKTSSSAGEARAEISRCSGSQFDPRLVRAFVNMSLGKMRLVIGPLSWLTHAPILARLPLTPSVGASFAGVAVLTTAAAGGLAVPRPAASAAPLRPAAPAQVTATQVESPLYPARAAGFPARAGGPSPSRATPPKEAGVTKRPASPHVTPRPKAAPAAAAPPATPKAPEPPSPGGSSPPAATTPSSPSPAPVAPGSPSPAPPRATPVPPSPSPTPPPSPPPVVANQPPTFAVGPSQNPLEDAGPQSVAGWATAISPGPGESAQRVTFVVANDNPALFASQPAVAPDGTLTYTPAVNANGLATVSVTAHDDGGTAAGGTDTSAPRTLTIAVAPVNDAPSFAAGPNQTVVSLLGAQSITGWATGISPGPADESGQAVTFVVANDNPGLFTVQPAVAPDGTLTYKPKLITVGTASVTIRAVDNGGTANGGSDSSVVRTFAITII